MIRIFAQVLLVFVICLSLSQLQCEAVKPISKSSGDSDTQAASSSSWINLERIDLAKIGLLKNCLAEAVSEAPSQTSGSIDSMTIDDGIAQFMRIDLDLLYKRDFVPSEAKIELTFLEEVMEPCQKVLALENTWFREAALAANINNYPVLKKKEDKLFVEEICRIVVAQVDSDDYGVLISSLSAAVKRIQDHIVFRQLGKFGAGKRICEEIKARLGQDHDESMRVLAKEVQFSCRPNMLDPFQPNLPAPLIAESIARTMNMFSSTSVKRADITDRESYAKCFKRVIAEPCQGVIEVLENWPQVRRDNYSLYPVHADCFTSESVCKSILSNLEEQIDLSYAEYLKMED